MQTKQARRIGGKSRWFKIETYGNDLKNLKMTRGDSANIAITGLNLVEGDVIKLTVKEHSNTPEKKMQIILTEFDAQGNGIIRITPDDTSGLDFRTYVYDIELTRVDKTVSTVVKKHEFKIEEEVSW